MSKKELIVVSLFLIVIGIAGRLLPHMWNATPIIAIALFSSAYLGFRYSFFVFLATMVLTDFFLGSYQWQIMLSVYGSFAVAGLIGLSMKKKRTVSLVFVSAMSSSLVFFLITNFAVWQFGSMYAHTWQGLFESYTMAIPFFRNSLIGDLFYTGVFFGVFEYIKHFILNRRIILSES